MHNEQPRSIGKRRSPVRVRTSARRFIPATAAAQNYGMSRIKPALDREGPALEKRYQVIIVGGGPVGVALGVELGSAVFRVRWWSATRRRGGYPKGKPSPSARSSTFTFGDASMSCGQPASCRPATRSEA